MKTVNHPNGQDIVAFIHQRMQCAPALEVLDRESWRRHVAYFEKLIAALAVMYGARYRRSGDVYEITLAGIRSGSTSGMRQMLLNWIAAAEKRLAKPDGTGGAA